MSFEIMANRVIHGLTIKPLDENFKKIVQPEAVYCDFCMRKPNATKALFGIHGYTDYDCVKEADFMQGIVCDRCVENLKSIQHRLEEAGKIEDKSDEGED